MAFTYSKLAEVTVGSGGSATIAFNNIPQNYNDLVLKTSLRGTGSLIYDTAKVTFNGSTLGYSGRYMQGSGSAANSAVPGISAYIEILEQGANTTANTFSNGEMYIPNYSVSGINKSISSDVVAETNATTIYMRLSAAQWANTTTITSITLAPDVSSAWAQHSTATLYGVKAEV